jgi:hypothetical protein
MKGLFITMIIFTLLIVFANRNIHSKKRELATYEERVMWFLKNYYESGMEYDILLISMEGADLDNFEWYDDIIHIPKYKDELDE